MTPCKTLDLRGSTFYSDKMRAKGLGELLEGIYGIDPQIIKPSHHHRSQAGGKYFANQSFVLRIDSHPLVELAHMFHRIHSTIVNGERGQMESPRKFRPLYLTCERWFWDLIQCLHCKRWRFRLVEFSTFIYNCHPPHHYRTYHDWREFVSTVHGVTSFLSHLPLAAWLCCYFAFEIRDFPLESGFCLYGRCVHCPLNIFPDLFPIQDWESHLVVENPQTLSGADLSGVDLILSCLTDTLTNAQILPTDGANCRDTFLVLKPMMYGILA